MDRAGGLISDFGLKSYRAWRMVLDICRAKLLIFGLLLQALCLIVS
jgi:hypothetical protein